MAEPWESESPSCAWEPNCLLEPHPQVLSCQVASALSLGLGRSVSMCVLQMRVLVQGSLTLLPGQASTGPVALLAHFQGSTHLACGIWASHLVLRTLVT